MTSNTHLILAVTLAVFMGITGAVKTSAALVTHDAEECTGGIEAFFIIQEVEGLQRFVDTAVVARDRLRWIWKKRDRWQVL